MLKPFNEKEPSDGTNEILHYENIIAKIGFYTYDEKLLYECKYSYDTRIQQIIKDFLSKHSLNSSENSLNKENLSFFLKNSQIYEKLEVDKKSILYYLARIKDTTLMIMEANESKSDKSDKSDNSRLKPVKSAYLKIYVQNEKRFNHIPKNIDEYIIENTYLIGKPIINELKYYIYNKRTKESKIIRCTKDDYNKINIKYFSRNSVYCNANNCVYVYECVDNINNNYGFNCNYDNSNKFFEINLITHKIDMISLKFPKRILHSMIFIPECYIFILGGKDTRQVLVYKMRPGNENYEDYPHLLPSPLLEPSLIVINNQFLYAFENSTVRFKIVRTNFVVVSPFEEINTKDYIVINQKFFGLVKFDTKNSILFLGGQILNLPLCKTKKCFEFDYSSNLLTLSKRDFQDFDFGEKTFIPMEKGIYMQIAELKVNNKYIQKVVYFYSEIPFDNKEKDNSVKKGPRYRGGGFESVQSNEVKISVAPNIISLVGENSIPEIGIPLYNNK